jgi:hypothetical protein
MKSLILSATLALSIALAGGCSGDPAKGYTTTRQYRDDIHSVAVSIFTRGKDVYRRDIEFQLTEAIQKRVQQNTPYRLAKRANADSELTGELTLISQQVLSYNSDNGQPREMQAEFAVSFIWKDRRGNVLAKRDNLRVSGSYVTEAPYREDFFQGSEDIINKIAMLVVEHMESEW